MSNVAPSAAPPHAIRVWADDINVYGEVPSVNGPCVIAYPRSEGGLCAILQTLGAMRTADDHGTPYQRPPVASKALLAAGLDQRHIASAGRAIGDMLKGVKK